MRLSHGKKATPAALLLLAVALFAAGCAADSAGSGGEPSTTTVSAGVAAAETTTAPAAPASTSTTAGPTTTTIRPANLVPVPYYQFDERWAKQPYNDGSNNDKVRGSGCAPALMAMVVATLRDPEIDPGVACAWSVEHGFFTPDPGRTKEGFFKAYADEFGISVRQLTELDLREAPAEEAALIHEEALEAVKNGDWVIARMGKGPWTTNSHFVLWYDAPGDEVLIRDSNSKKAAKARNTYSLFLETVVRYWVIDVDRDEPVA